MFITSSNGYSQLENWLYILINTYRDFPSNGLAKVIHYYIERIINDEDISNNSIKYCQYSSMKKFWAWKSSYIAD